MDNILTSNVTKENLNSLVDKISEIFYENLTRSEEYRTRPYNLFPRLCKRTFHANFNYFIENKNYYFKFGRLIFTYNTEEAHVVNLHLYTHPSHKQEIGIIEFCPENMGIVLSALSNDFTINHPNNNHLSSLYDLGSMMFMVVQSLKTLENYIFPQGCWIPQVDDDAVSFLRSYGMLDPTLILSDEATESLLKLSPKKIKTELRTSDDIAL